MKQGNWKSNKARKQDNARRRRKPPVGRTALPKPDETATPFLTTLILGMIGTIIVIGVVVGGIFIATML